MTGAPPDPAAGAVRARHAASLLLLRDDGRVLMGLRGAGHRFMPNRLVFPGGSVDRADALAPTATDLHPATRTMLERTASPALARALAIAAARELEEETGLALGQPPALDAMRYLCRAVTPPGRPIRFNARFLVVPAGHATGSLAGSGELEGLRWYDVEEALALPLALPTQGVLRHLLAWRALPSPGRDATRATEVLRSQVWRPDRGRGLVAAAVQEGSKAGLCPDPPKA